MSARQLFVGMLGFETRDALEEAVHAAPASARAKDLLARARREDCVLVVDHDASLASSAWLELTGTLAELGAMAESGHVTMLYQGDGDELALAGPARRLHALSVQRPSRWLPLAQTVTHELRRAGAPIAEPDGSGEPMQFAPVTYARQMRGLDVGDWLGIIVDLVPDGDRIFALGSPRARESVDLTQPQDMRVVAELDRPGATHLMAFEGKELVSLVRVVGSESIQLRDRRVSDALAIDVEEHDVAMEAAPYLRSDWRSAGRIAARRRRTRLWLERDVGIIALQPH